MNPLSILSTVKLSNGLDMPTLGLGTWRSDNGKVEEAVAYALKHGYTHIDAAYCYENQDEVGRGIKKSGVPREKVFVTSKLWNTHHRPENARVHIKKILKDLDLDYLDQLVIHWPVAFKLSETETHPTIDGVLQLDSECNIADTWAVLEEFYKQGTLKSIGVSNFKQDMLQRLLDTAQVKPMTNQIEVQPYFNNTAMLDFCKQAGVHVVAYSPLGNFDPSSDLPSAIKDETIAAIAKKHSKSPAQIIIRWHLQRGVTVIPKTVTESRIKENADVFDFELTHEDMLAMEALGAKNFRICNPYYGPGGELQWPGDTTAF